MNRRGVLVHVPFGLVLMVVLVALVRIGQAHWREGALLVGVAMVLAATLRAVLSPEAAGLLVVRGRGVDVLTYGAFGVMIILVAATIEGGPFD
jgi:hypothetical protein